MRRVLPGEAHIGRKIGTATVVGTKPGRIRPSLVLDDGRVLNMSGRPHHVQNRPIRELREAILEAVTNLGSDGNGRDGLIGWLMKLGREKPVVMAGLLRSLLPLKVQADPTMPAPVFQFPPGVLATLTPEQLTALEPVLLAMSGQPSAPQPKTIEADPSDYARLVES